MIAPCSTASPHSPRKAALFLDPPGLPTPVWYIVALAFVWLSIVAAPLPAPPASS